VLLQNIPTITSLSESDLLPPPTEMTHFQLLSTRLGTKLDQTGP
jgi:hypothetical protein